MLKYSVIIPVMNERGSLFLLHKSLTEVMSLISQAYEIIFVDDGSTDGSREVIEKIGKEDLKCRYIFFDRNYGKSSAEAAGFSSALGEVIIIMDADLEVLPQDIPLLLEKIDSFDAVFGYREKRSDSWVKRISSNIANLIYNVALGENLRDVNCPLKAFKREVLKNIIFFDGMHRFFPALMRLEGYTFTQVPVRHCKRLYGVSKYNIKNRILKTFVDLSGVLWLKKRYLKYKIISEK